MILFEIFLIGIALSLDAFAVSVCKGLQVSKQNKRSAIIVGLYFGFFQALMPFLGYYLGASLESFMSAYSSYISFAILVLLGLNMLKEALKKEEDEDESSSNPLAFAVMTMAAIATSIDAFAVGIVLKYNYTISIFLAISIIGCTTFIISIIGVRLGYLFSDSFRKKAEIIGACVLILLGVKFLFGF